VNPSSDWITLNHKPTKGSMGKLQTFTCNLA
jgi:hypothetical protein